MNSPFEPVTARDAFPTEPNPGCLDCLGRIKRKLVGERLSRVRIR